MSPSPVLQLLLSDDTSADVVDTRILDAALEQFALVGIRRTSADDIARRAGVNRTTLYRRMGNKDDIVRSAIIHEIRGMLAQIEAEVGSIQDVSERIVDGTVLTVMLLRDNRVLRQSLAVDRGETLAQITLGAGEALRVGAVFVAEQIRRARTDLGLPAGDDVDTLAAILVRLVHSLVVIPDGPPDLTSSEQLRTFAQTMILPLVTGHFQCA
jgi:AcrR family transcriptional regulator